MSKKYIIKEIIKWFILLISNSVFGQQIEIINLNDCHTDAIANYPSSKDKLLYQQISNMKIENLNANYLPQLSVNGQFSYQSNGIDISIPMTNPVTHTPMTIGIDQKLDQYKIALDINQVIYDGHTTKYQKELQETSGEVDVQQVEVDLYKVREQVNNVFFLIINLQENEKLIETSISELLERERTAYSNIINGVQTNADLDMLKAQRISFEQELNEMKINRKSALHILQILTGKTYNDSVKLLLPHPQFSDTAQTLRPELKLYDLQSISIENSRKLTGTALLPKIYAFAEGGVGLPGLNMVSQTSSGYYIVGASLKWNVYDWNQTHRQKAIAEVQKQMVENRKESFTNNLSIDLENKMVVIENLKETIRKDSILLDLRHRITLLAISQLNNGVITTSEYITQFTAETIARINTSTHLIQLEQAKINYLFTKGQILF